MIMKETFLPDRERLTTLLDPHTESLVLKYMPQTSALEEMTEVLSALADNGRLRIISALSICEMCVGDMSSLLSINQTTLSHQLRLLRAAGIVKCKKQGKVVFYSLSGSDVLDLMLLASRICAASDA